MTVIDDAVTLILNQNLTPSAFTANREFGVVTSRPDTVQAAAISSSRGPGHSSSSCSSCVS
jgi:hypothetical protein